MRIKYSVSLTNYIYYTLVHYQYTIAPSLERAIMLIRQQNYGIEVSSMWRDERDLFDEVGRKRLKYLLKGMKVSLHTARGNTFDLHQKQIDAAVAFGAEVIVLHTHDLISKDNFSRDEDNFKLDVGLASEVVAYGAEHGIKLALENSQGLSFPARAIEKIEGLGVCLDVGHVYFTSDPMSKYLDVLKERIIHLHLQDILTKEENGLPSTPKDHYIPGSGGIPDTDWQLLAATLKEINFQGMAVFEVRPRNPLQTALLGMNFMQKFLQV